MTGRAPNVAAAPASGLERPPAAPSVSPPVSPPDAPTPGAQPLGDLRFRLLVGEADWARLPAPIRRRFSKRLADSRTVVYVGKIHEAANRAFSSEVESTSR